MNELFTSLIWSDTGIRMDSPEVMLARIAKSMAGDGKDPLLAQINILTKSEVTTTPRTASEIDKSLGTPAAVSSDGRRFYPYLCNDGTGRLDIVNEHGKEITYKFHLPSDGPAIRHTPLMRTAYGMVKGLKQRHEALLVQGCEGTLDKDAFEIVRIEVSGTLSAVRTQLFQEIEGCQDPTPLPPLKSLELMHSASPLLVKAIDDTLSYIEKNSNPEWLKNIKVTAQPTIEVTRVKAKTPPQKPKSKYKTFLVAYSIVVVILWVLAVLTNQFLPSMEVYFGLTAIIVSMPLLGIFLGFLNIGYQKLKIKTRF